MAAHDSEQVCKHTHRCDLSPGPRATNDERPSVVALCLEHNHVVGAAQLGKGVGLGETVHTGTEFEEQEVQLETLDPEVFESNSCQRNRSRNQPAAACSIA